MKSLILQEPGYLLESERPSSALPQQGEALVRIHRVGVCGTDIHAYGGNQPFFAYPRVLGHELGVEVLQVGEGVTHIRVGDRCAVEPYWNAASASPVVVANRTAACNSSF